MAVFDREQLDTLKRQVEDDYRLDLAAIERIQRRFFNAANSASTTTGLTPGNLPTWTPAPASETQGSVLPRLETTSIEGQSDELTGTLRAMFSTHRK